MKEDVEVTAVAVEARAGSLDVICRSPEIAMQQEALKQGKRGQAESGFSKPCYGFWALRSAVREVVAEVFCIMLQHRNNGGSTHFDDCEADKKDGKRHTACTSLSTTHKNVA